MLMNREEWIFGCQVRNQSVENGSMPFGGDTPFSSLYSLSRRSRDSETSLSSSCRRAPSWINSMASWISWASETTLFLLMICIYSTTVHTRDADFHQTGVRLLVLETFRL